VIVPVKNPRASARKILTRKRNYRPVKVVYYTLPFFLDTALPFIREMSRRVELHLLLELTPESWANALFDVTPKTLPAGILPAKPILKDYFPPGVVKYWEETASFNLIVYNCPQSIHPSTFWVSHIGTQFIRSLKPDLVHLDDISLRLPWVLFELRRIPIVLNLHDPEPHAGEGIWQNRIGRILTFRQIRQFILRNQAQLENFLAQHKSPCIRVDVIPLGVLDVFREWIDGLVTEDDNTVLFFGRLSHYKGLEVLLEAAPWVAERVPGVRFIIAGRMMSNYRLPKIPVLPNGGRVELLDHYIPNFELARLFQEAALVVCPYTEATQSGVVLTAYAFGKPVVATQIGGLPEYVEDGITGYLIPPGNALILAERIIKLLQEPAQRRRMGDYIRNQTHLRLSWEAIAEQTLLVYQKALQLVQSEKDVQDLSERKSKDLRYPQQGEK
jgi:glycosyltransferase involved in cell wall biosynthesis